MRRRIDGSAPVAAATALLACAASCVLACALGCSPAARPPAASASASPTGSAELSGPLPSPVPDVVARVNGQPIRLAQLLPQAQAELRRPSAIDGEPRKAEALRRALRQYVERELLVQEALARGIVADDRQVAWAYDQLRLEYADEAAWVQYLAGSGLDVPALRAELRVQKTIAALLEREAAARGVTPDQARSQLLEKLRASARVELFL
jgi:hypothetical protein